MNFLILVFICGAFAQLETNRIKIENFPYNAVVLKSDQQVGNGAILSKRFVATAASCLYINSPANFSIRAGSTKWGQDGQLVQVEKVYIHPNFQDQGPKGYFYDYGLLKLAEDLEFSNYVKPVSLAWKDPESDKLLLITGWHYTNKPEDDALNGLQFSFGSVWDHAECKFNYSSMHVVVHENMNCANFNLFELGNCFVDNGGPFVKNDTLFGIGTSNYECGKHRNPNLYSRIPPAFDWYATYTGQKKSGAIRNNLSVFSFIVLTLWFFIDKFLI